MWRMPQFLHCTCCEDCCMLFWFWLCSLCPVVRHLFGSFQPVSLLKLMNSLAPSLAKHQTSSLCDERENSETDFQIDQLSISWKPFQHCHRTRWSEWPNLRLSYFVGIWTYQDIQTPISRSRLGCGSRRSWRTKWRDSQLSSVLAWKPWLRRSATWIRRWFSECIIFHAHIIWVLITCQIMRRLARMSMVMREDLGKIDATQRAGCMCVVSLFLALVYHPLHCQLFPGSAFLSSSEPWTVDDTWFIWPFIFLCMALSWDIRADCCSPKQEAYAQKRSSHCTSSWLIEYDVLTFNQEETGKLKRQSSHACVDSEPPEVNSHSPPSCIGQRP